MEDLKIQSSERQTMKDLFDNFNINSNTKEKRDAVYQSYPDYLKKSDISNLNKITDERVNKIISQVKADDGVILYVYLRGSHCHGLNTDTSDEDYGMFYAAKVENLLDLGFNYKEQYEDKKHDVYCQEISKVARLILKSNPTVLETLFVDDEFVIYEHPVITELKKKRYNFLTKECYKPFFGYAKSQLLKASSQKKAVMKEILTRKTPLDFCYVPHKQGSGHFTHWLEYRGLKQAYIGLISVPHMKNYYGGYYDWGNFFKHENITLDMLLDALHDRTVYDTIAIVREMKEARERCNEEKATEWEELLHKAQFKNMVNFICEKNHLNISSPDIDEVEQDVLFSSWFNEQKPIGYCGVIAEDGDSNEVRFYDVEKVQHSQKDDKSVILCSIPKNSEPIVFLYFEKDGYSTHCKEYKEQQEWIAKRNPERFRQNLENMQKIKERKEEKGFYDAKNCCEMQRCLTNWLEIVRDGKYIVNRRNIDREYLLKIKRGELTYNEIIEDAKKKMTEAEKYTKSANLPEHCDVDLLNKWLLDLRMKQLHNQL